VLGIAGRPELEHHSSFGRSQTVAKGPSSRASKASRSVSGKQPEAVLVEISTGMAILKTGTELVKDAAKTFKKETVLEISVLDSTTTDGKHHVTISFANKSDQGIYIESLTIHRPGEDNKEFSILKDSGLDVVFVPIRGPEIETPGISFDSPRSATQGRVSLFPQKLGIEEPLEFELVFNLLNRENMIKNPHLVANMVYSKLDEKIPKTHRFYFQLRWPS
jgi:hypothetical protein